MAIEYFKTLKRDKIKQMLDMQYDFVLIDILPPEYYEDVHIKGAVNACVYEVDFIQQVEALVPDRQKTIVVSCNNALSKATDVALKKLNEAGYPNVYIYREGTIDWQRARNPVEGKNLHNLNAVQIQNKVYTIDPAESVIEWTGRNILGARRGTLHFQSGSIPILHRQPDKVSFVIDMNSIQDLDIQDPEWNRILVDHLKSEDFFDVENFPTASFEATSFKAIEGSKGGGVPNYEVRGKLAMKGVINEIAFPAVLILREDGALAAEAHFDIDRTLWNVNYGSAKFFEKLGKHLVHDFITIQLKLVAR